LNIVADPVAKPRLISRRFYPLSPLAGRGQGEGLGAFARDVRYIDKAVEARIKPHAPHPNPLPASGEREPRGGSMG